MNWDAIGALGEVIGALAVVASLIYLSFQIRQAAKTAEDAAFRDVFASVGDHMGRMLDAENRPVLLKGLADYQSLNPEDKFTFDGIFVILVTMVESSVISNAAELMKDETMDNWRYYMGTRFFAYPGAQDWWKDSRPIYITELQEFFDEIIASVDQDSDFWGIKAPPFKSSETDT